MTDVASLLLRAARGTKPLTADAEAALVLRVHAGDRAALGALVIANVRLVLSRARRLRGYGLPEDDLVQEGMVGLLEAAARFDVSRGVRFSTYALWWVKAAQHEFVLRNWSIVRGGVSDEQRKLFFNLRRLKARLSRDPAASPATVRAAIAAAVGVSVADVEAMEGRLALGDVSLNAPARWDEDGETEVGDTLADTGTRPDDLAAGFVDDDEVAASLRGALDALDERERLIVEERWLAEDVAPLGALAEWFGVTAAKVRCIELGAIVKLRAAMVARKAPALAWA